MKNRISILNLATTSHAHSIFVGAIAVLLASQSSQASLYDWVGASATTWDTGWTAANVPTISDDLTILGPLNAAGVLNINVFASTFAKTINFTNTSATTLTNTTSGSNKTLTLQNGLTTGTGAVTIGSNTVTQGINIALGASQIWTIGSGGLTYAGSTTSLATISGVGFGITKEGTGNLTLNGANTYSGGTTLNAGTLTVGTTGTYALVGGVGTLTAGGLGTGTLTLNGGTLASSNNNIGNATTVNANIAIGGGNRLEISGPWNLSGGTRTLTLNRANAFSAANSNTLALQLNTQSNGPQVSVAGGTMRLVADAAVAATSYTGVNFFGNTNFIGNAGLTIGDRVVVSVNNTDVFGGSSGTNLAALTLESGGYLNMSGITFTSPRNETVFTLSGSGGTVTDLSTVAGTSILTVNGTGGTTFSGNIVDGSALGSTASGGNNTFSGIASIGVMGFTKSGTGTQVLGGANTYSGATVVNVGSTLKLGSTTALGSGGSTGKAFRYASSNTSAGANLTTVASGAAVDLGGQTVSGEGFSIAGIGVSSTGAITNSSTAASLSGGNLNTVTIGASGTATTLTGTPTITASGGGGTGFTATAGIGLATLTSAGGTGYTTAPTVTVSGGGGTGLVITTALSSGVVTYTVVNPGTGYTSLPTLGLTGGAGGSGASISAAALGLTSLTVTNFGTGYTSAPTLAVSTAEGLSSAAVTATIPTIAMTASSSIGGSGDISIGLPVTGAFALTKVGANTLTLSGANTYSGVTTISAGVLSANTLTNGLSASSIGAATNASANIVLNNGTLKYTGATVSIDRGMTVNTTNGGTIEVTDSGANLSTTGTVVSSASSAANLIKTGAGILTLAGIVDNNFLGVTVNAGTLVLGKTSSSSVHAVGAGLTIGTNGTAQLAGSNGDQIYDGTFVTVNGGLFDINSRSETVAAVTLDGGSITGSGGTLTGSSYAVKSGSVSAILGGSGIALTKSTTGTVTLSGANTYTGATAVNAGTLKVTHASGLGTTAGGTSVAANGVLDLQAAVLAEAITLNGTGISNGGALINSSNSVSGSLTGAITLGSASTITAAGTGASNLSLGLSGGINNAGFLLTFDGANNTSVSGTKITGSGGLAKTGAGTLTLSAVNDYSGATAVNGGKLVVGVGGIGSIASHVTVSSGATLGGSGTITGNVILSAESSTNVQDGGKLAVGNSPGTLTVTGDTTFNTGSIFEWDLAASKNADGVDEDGVGGTDFDSVSVGGNIVVNSGAIFKVILGSSALTDIADTENAFWNTPYGTQTWNMTSIFGEAFYSGAFTSVTTLQDVSTYGSFTINGSSLTWSAVPEPSSALAGLLIAAGLCHRSRRND